VHSASGHLCRACIRMMGTARRKAGPSLIYICSKERDAVERRRARAAHTATSHCAAAPSLAPRSTDIQQAHRTAAGLVAYEELCTGLAHAPPRRTPTPALHSTSHHGPRCTPTPALQNPPRTPAHAHSSHALLTTNTWAQRLGLAEHPGARSGTYLALAGPCPGPRQYPP